MKYISSVILCVLSLATAARAQSTDPNLAGAKEDPRYQKEILRDKDTRAAPGVDHTEQNRKADEDRKAAAAKAEQKAEQQKKYDKEKEKLK